MSNGVSLNRAEILQVAEVVAREKMIDRDVILGALEEAVQKTAKIRYGNEYDIRASINRKTGEVRVIRVLKVCEVPTNTYIEIAPADALRRTGKTYALDEEIVEELPPIDFGRISAQSAKQIILQKVREAERDKQVTEFKDRIGEIIMCTVKRVEFGTAVVDLGGRGEAMMRRDDLLPRELLKVGDRVRGYVVDVRREVRGPQVFVSRTHPQFMAKLFAAEVPEVYDGTVEIKAVARDPGSRAKIVVSSRDASVDPVGACVGMRGCRVQAVTSELQGEKIDIIPYTADIAALAVQALAPAKIVKVVLDEDVGRMDVIVDDDQLSPAIGRRGQNVRLAAQVTGWKIDIMTETEYSTKRQNDFERRTELFMTALDVDNMIAQCLAAEDFETPEEVAFVAADELLSIDGFEAELVQVLQDRARVWVAAQEAASKEALAPLGLSVSEAAALNGSEVKTLEDFAGLTPDDLVDPGEGLFKAVGTERPRAEALILDARRRCGWLESKG